MKPEDVPAGPLLIDTDVATWLLTGVDEAEPWQPLLRGHLLSATSPRSRQITPWRWSILTYS